MAVSGVKERDSFNKQKSSNLVSKYTEEIREHFLSRLINGNVLDMNSVRSQARELKLPCDGFTYRVCAVSTKGAETAVDAEAILCLIKENIGTYASKQGFLLHCCVDQLCRLCILISSDSGHDDFVAFKDSLEPFLLSITRRTGVDLHYGIGSQVDQIELLSESYSYAIAMLEHSMTAKNGDSITTRKLSENYADDIHKQLLQLFRNGDMDAITETINYYLEMIRLDRPGRQVLVERFAVIYLQNITNECMRLGITLERFESYIPAVVCLMQLDSIGSVSALLSLTEQILKYIGMHRTAEGNHLLNMAKEFILNNLGNERLDLAAVSDHVGLSRVYFCKLFHQLEGTSFSVYLKNARVEKAKQLLLTTNMKVFEVSNAVGFSHAKYFGHVFKEMVGQTPVEFQKGLRNDL